MLFLGVQIPRPEQDGEQGQPPRHPDGGGIPVRQRPAFRRLTGKDAKFPGDIKWNFGKFLIDRNGEVLERFSPEVKPSDDKIIASIEKALKDK